VDFLHQLRGAAVSKKDRLRSLGHFFGVATKAVSRCNRGASRMQPKTSA